MDWWALGILVYEMIAGYPPFYDENPFGIYQKILGGRIDFPRHFDAKARDLVRKLLTADKTKRLGCMKDGALDVKLNKWFARLNWEAVYACAIPPPFVPDIRGENDTRNFEDYPDSDGDTALDLSPAESKLFDDLSDF